MGAYYDEIEIEDMSWDKDKKVYHYPCPCGDRFEISKGQLKNYEDIATCPSCSLIIRVIYDPVRQQIISAVYHDLTSFRRQLDFEDYESEEEDDEGEEEEEQDSDNESFHEVLENLTLEEKSQVLVATA
jgi:diphthamide biosynthesis protein 3